MFSLRGIFPAPKKENKRNFIKENVRQLRTMQNNRGTEEVKPPRPRSRTSPTSPPRAKIIPKLHKANITAALNKMTISKSKGNSLVHKIDEVDLAKRQRNVDLKICNGKCAGGDAKVRAEEKSTTTFRHVACQYVDPSGQHIFGDGGNYKVMYPSQEIIDRLDTGASIKCSDRDEVASQVTAISNEESRRDMTDFERLQPSFHKSSELFSPAAAKTMQSKFEASCHDNIGVIRLEDKPDPMLPPPTYKKGVIPKYLQERKELQREADRAAAVASCPPGHVLLTEAERVTTLNFLNQKFSNLVSELNKMPVRSDTLRMRLRKMEIDKELEKLEDDIRVFSRPKVICLMEA